MLREIFEDIIDLVNDFIRWLLFSEFFNPNSSFFKLRSVWLAVAIISSGSYWVYNEIIKSGNYIACYSASCFNEAVTIFKVPLGILSLLIPIIAVLAANHRSEQTKKQIEISKEQNNFTNYYKHLEEFEKYYEKFEKSRKINGFTDQPLSARSIHNTFFHSAIHGVLHIEDDLIEHVEKVYSRVVNILKELEALQDQEDSPSNRFIILGYSEQLLQGAKYLSRVFNINLKMLNVENLAYQRSLLEENLNSVNYFSQSVSLHSLLLPFTNFEELWTYVYDFLPMENGTSSSIVIFKTLSYNSKARLICSREEPFNITFGEINQSPVNL